MFITLAGWWSRLAPRLKALVVPAVRCNSTVKQNSMIARTEFDFLEVLTL